jgi:hypothetical protein
MELFLSVIFHSVIFSLLDPLIWIAGVAAAFLIRDWRASLFGAATAAAVYWLALASLILSYADSIAVLATSNNLTFAAGMAIATGLVWCGARVVLNVVLRQHYGKGSART